MATDANPFLQPLGQAPATDTNPFLQPLDAQGQTPPVLPPQGGMTPWRAATANPVQDLQANLALAQNRQFGTPLPVNQQQNEPETIAQAQAALTQDPAGLAANALQGVSLDTAGYFNPAIKQRAESYAGMHPTAAGLAQVAPQVGEGLFTGGMADLAAARLALRPLARVLVRYAPASVGSAVKSFVDTPETAPTSEKSTNALVGALTGIGGQLGADVTGNVVNRYLTGRLPTYRPVVTPAITGALKTGATGLGGYLMHELVPWSESALAPLAYFSHGVRDVLASGPKDIATSAKNLWHNLYGALSTPSGPARVAGRFVPGRFPPTRSALPGALAAPYAAGVAPTWPGQLAGEWIPGQSQQQ